MERKIIVRGARENNLKNVDVEIPRDKLTVFTGLSGSGKSSLAFDTLYAEGHRRFVESLSSYARMFLGQLDKPDVDSIEGLSPAVAIDQKTTSKNPRSTVGTVTEIYDYLRLLYARIGVPHCPVCGKEISMQTTDSIVDRVMQLPEGTRFLILAPVVRGAKGMHEKVLANAKKSGFVRVKIDGSIYDLSEEIHLDKNKKHDIDIVVDRLVMKPDLRSRLSDSAETALHAADGYMKAEILPRDGGQGEILEFSQNFACEKHNISLGELEPRMFSFNNPCGACPRCSGLGELSHVSPDKLIPDRSLSIAQGAIVANGFKSTGEDSWSGPLIAAVGKSHGFTLDMPISDFSEEALHALFYGTGNEMYDVVRTFGKRTNRSIVKFEGIVNTVERRIATFPGDNYSQFLEQSECPECHGKRLNPSALAVTVGGISISELCSLTVERLVSFFGELNPEGEKGIIARDILKEIRSRLGFLQNVGLSYLTLSRQAGTLSGGEAQRIRLATQMGSALTGVMYVLDEPSIGLHQRDNGKLIATMKKLRDLGNTVLVVEHDEETMMNADFIVDIGPGAGVHGGKLIAAAPPKEFQECRESVTANFLSGRRVIALPAVRRSGNGQFLTIRGAKQNNLKNIDVSIPLGTFTCVTGVSGSGKSSLVNMILYRALARQLNRAFTVPGKYDSIEGTEYLDKVICIDQSPIGRTPRSNPATYTGVFNDIRALFAATKDAKQRGYTQGRFSFNVAGGRCEACQGDGVKCIEMHFLPDVYVKCDVCHGHRYNRDTLEVRFKGKNISDVLEMTIEEALSFFADIPTVSRKLSTLCDVGLGYVRLGQSATTFSGGEAQRVKLAYELAKRSTGKTIYVLDEPTTGLAAADVEHLLAVLQRLVDAGNTVLVIEHNLDVIKCADYILDLGPEGGEGGGQIVAAGTPEEIAASGTYTGQYLKIALEKSRR
ncbi:MAG: excinuclease ABC subunit UvrA [Eubacteriales bacterium]|nr:excinuclease ABC subunit UvrA [Eubacteriales bacterium]